jgi:hypothetical protein
LKITALKLVGEVGPGFGVARGVVEGDESFHTDFHGDQDGEVVDWEGLVRAGSKEAGSQKANDREERRARKGGEEGEVSER